MTVLELQKPAAAKRPAGSTMAKAEASLIHDLAIGCIVNANVPLSTFDDPFLNAMLSQYSPRLARDVPLGRHTLTQELERIYRDARTAIQKELDEAVTSIHISFDVWASPNQLTMIAVIGRFLDRNLKYQTRLLASRRNPEDHSRESRARTIEKVIREWGLESRIGVSICDNTFDNDSCLAALYPRLDPRYGPKDVKHRRMRCLALILNLVTKAFFYGDGADAFELDSDHLEKLGDRERALQHWRRKGPVGKLHNIVKFIRASEQRMEAFRKAGIGNETAGELEIFSISEPSGVELGLMENNAVRLNSTLQMVRWACEKRVQILTYLHALEIERPMSGMLPDEDRLSINDWRVLGGIREALEPIYCMMSTEVKNNTDHSRGQLWSLQLGIEHILEHLEHIKGLYGEDPADQNVESVLEQACPESSQSSPRRHRQPRPYYEAAFGEHIGYTSTDVRAADMQPEARAFIRASINNAWAKLNHYYTSLDESPLFAAAVILHPSFGLPYLEELWSDQSQRLVDVKRDLETYFDC